MTITIIIPPSTTQIASNGLIGIAASSMARQDLEGGLSDIILLSSRIVTLRRFAEMRLYDERVETIIGRNKGRLRVMRQCDSPIVFG